MLQNIESQPGTLLFTVDEDGLVEAIVTDDLAPLLGALGAQGEAIVERASHVEPEGGALNAWVADMSPVGGPLLRGFSSRAEALESEVAWLHANHFA